MANQSEDSEDPAKKHPYRFYWLTAGLSALIASTIVVVTTHPWSKLPDPSPRSTYSSGSSNSSSGSDNSSNTPAPTSGSPGSSNASTAGSNHALLYGNKTFALNGDGCNDDNSDNNFPNVQFLSHGLSNVQHTPYRPSSPFGLVLDCSKLSIAYGGSVAIVTGNPDYDSCYSALTNHAHLGDILLKSLNLKTHLCLINSLSTKLAVVTLHSLSDSATDTSWSASVYKILANT